MATILTDKQKEVIRKIIYAVETGGQTYDKCDYSSLIAAGTNTSNEVAITIGAGQWYGTEAKTLLDLIRSTDKATFSKLDTAGIASDLDNKNWSRYSITTTSAKAKCIKSIITSEVGIKCQDTLMESQITSYAASIQKTYGTMTADGIAECINIKHQGGDSALKRILAKTTKPYNAKNIYAALCTDPADKSSNNQVGDYESRQKAVYNMITKYLGNNTEAGKTTTNNISTNKATTSTKTEQVTVKTESSSISGTLNTKCKYKGIVTAKSLNVRDWAGETGTKVLRTLTKGKEVEVCDTIKDDDGDEWYYIKESGKYGFVSAAYVKVAATSSTTTFNKGDKVKVKSGSKWIDGKGIASFVFNLTMYVIGTNSEGIIISTSKNGAATGVISKSNLTKV
jgi:hypothetical protein